MTKGIDAREVLEGFPFSKDAVLHRLRRAAGDSDTIALRFNDENGRVELLGAERAEQTIIEVPTGHAEGYIVEDLYRLLPITQKNNHA